MPEEKTSRRVLIRDLADLWHRLAELDSESDEDTPPEPDPEDPRLQGAIEMARATGHALGQPMQALALSISTLQHSVARNSPVRRDVDDLAHAFIRVRQVLFRLQEVEVYATRDCGGGNRMIDIEQATPR